MKAILNYILGSLLLWIFSTQPAFSQRIEKPVEVVVTYIANEGFLIKCGEKKILIDALFGEKDYGFCDIPRKGVMDSMINSAGIFENIDLVSVTHNHIDHICAPYVCEFLLKHPESIFVSCSQSTGQFRESADFNSLQKQVVEITPDSLQFIDTIINEIGVRVYRILHGPYYEVDTVTGEKINLHRNIQNIGFLFNINGVRIFHGGDSNPYAESDYAQFRLDKENIDIAFIDRSFMVRPDCAGIDIINKYIKPKYIVLMHIQHEKSKYFIDVTKQIVKKFPEVKVFENEMETYKVTIK